MPLVLKGKTKQNSKGCSTPRKCCKKDVQCHALWDTKFSSLQLVGVLRQGGDPKLSEYLTGERGRCMEEFWAQQSPKCTKRDNAEEEARSGTDRQLRPFTPCLCCCCFIFQSSCKEPCCPDKSTICILLA